MVGIGTSNTDRKNAHVIKSDTGDHFIIGIGGYEGKDTDSAQSLQEVVNGLSSKSDVYIIDFSYFFLNSPTFSSEEIDTAIGGWDNFIAAIKAKKIISGSMSGESYNQLFLCLGSGTTSSEGVSNAVVIFDYNDRRGMLVVTNTGGTLTAELTNSNPNIDVTTLFANTATITSGLSSQIAAFGAKGNLDYPVFWAGSDIGNIKPTWIRTLNGVTNFMCIADNKIWYFEIQGTTVQRAELAIS